MTEPMTEYIDFDPDQAYTIDPKETWIRLACCDCGLVHDIILEIVETEKGLRLKFTLETNEEATDKAKAELAERELTGAAKDLDDLMHLRKPKEGE